MNQPTLRFTRSFMGALSLCFALLAPAFAQDADPIKLKTLRGVEVNATDPASEGIRFGPDGANDDLEKAIESVVEALTKATKAETEAAAIVKTIAPVIADLKAMKATLENIRSAFGPKAARAAAIGVADHLDPASLAGTERGDGLKDNVVFAR